MENIVQRVYSKLFPDDICAVEAHIMSHNYTIWQVMSHQTSLILRDEITVEGFQVRRCWVL